jgi:hypothetical protein
MSLVPELILQQMIVQGIRAFREDERLLRMLFRNFTLEEVEGIQKFFRDDSIDISLNYPDAELKLPAIVILLKAESESQAFLRDFQQSASNWDGSMPLAKAELLGDQTVLGSGSRTTVGEPGQLHLAPTTATGGTSDTIVAAEGEIIITDPYEGDVYVVTMEGTGAGQRKLVSSIIPSENETGTVITVDSAWTTIPDDTTVFKLIGPFVDPDEQVVGEWPKLYDSDDLALERFGSIYRVSYTLNIIAKDQELVIILYNVLKAIVVSSRRYLNRNGVINARMSGTDFIPNPEYYPSLAYSRAMTLEFEYHFDVFTTVNEALATRMELQLFVKQPDVRNPDDPERIVSNTEIDLS